MILGGRSTTPTRTPKKQEKTVKNLVSDHKKGGGVGGYGGYGPTDVILGHF